MKTTLTLLVLLTSLHTWAKSLECFAKDSLQGKTPPTIRAIFERHHKGAPIYMDIEHQTSVNLNSLVVYESKHWSVDNCTFDLPGLEGSLPFAKLLLLPDGRVFLVNMNRIYLAAADQFEGIEIGRTAFPEDSYGQLERIVEIRADLKFALKTRLDFSLAGSYLPTGIYSDCRYSMRIKTPKATTFTVRSNSAVGRDASGKTRCL